MVLGVGQMFPAGHGYAPTDPGGQYMPDVQATQGGLAGMYAMLNGVTIGLFISQLASYAKGMVAIFVAVFVDIAIFQSAVELTQ